MHRSRPELRNIPHAHRRVFAGRSEQPAVGTECQAKNSLRVAAKCEHFLAAGRVPDADYVVAAWYCQEAAAWVKRQVEASSAHGDAFAHGERIDRGRLP